VNNRTICLLFLFIMSCSDSKDAPCIELGRSNIQIQGNGGQLIFKQMSYSATAFNYEAYCSVSRERVVRNCTHVRSNRVPDPELASIDSAVEGSKIVKWPQSQLNSSSCAVIRMKIQNG
jgi:hypothetical protein